ncbi:MAG TPA: hypothetical protein GXX36_09470 [Clostridiaceae bacterium]|nr:hypothetical protein [Clostridiaceae bacterium]
MRKVYVDTTAYFTKEGDIFPIKFMWEDGRKYTVDKVLDKRKAASLKVGGQGIRYTCRVSGKEIYMYLEDGNRWFIEGK